MGDRLDWIFDRDASQDLASRYDDWAATYDEDHEAWGWRGPEAAVESLERLSERASFDQQLVLDAGCGTGRVGSVLKSDGGARLIGVDLSRGMLDLAASTDSYDDLLLGSLDALPLEENSVDAVISTGVFTHGHVDGDALEELCRVTRPAGLIVLTLRLDVIDHYQAAINALADSGAWTEVDRSAPVHLHPNHSETEQFVVAWRVNSFR